MGHKNLSFINVFFCYISQSHDVFENMNFDIPLGWTGIIGRNGSGKTTFLKLASGVLNPDRGEINSPDPVCYCPQVTDEMPPGFIQLQNTYSNFGGKLLSILGIGHDWHRRWGTLSFGERKKAQIATAMFQEPGLLAVDEPTNHLDSESTAQVLDVLNQYRGIGLIVSHNRRILDKLCHRCLFISGDSVVLRRGNYSVGKKTIQDEKRALFRKLETEKRQLKRLKREVLLRKEKADHADNGKSKRGLDKKDHDTKSKINQAKLTGRDAVAGKLYNQLSGRVSQARDRVRNMKFEKDYKTGIWLRETSLKCDVILRIPQGELSITGNRKILHKGFVIRPDDKIGITGKNGSGKTTFLKFLLQKMEGFHNRILYIPQELNRETAEKKVIDIKQKSREDLGKIMTLVRRLGSDPERLFDKGAGSPGEIKKIMIAEGLLEEKQIIVMDEPVNHLDLLSVEALEEALARYPGCLITVSHDLNFLESVTRREWRLIESDDTRCVTELIQS